MIWNHKTTPNQLVVSHHPLDFRPHVIPFVPARNIYTASIFGRDELVILTTITRQTCRPHASILGLRNDLEWPNKCYDVEHDTYRNCYC